MEYHYGTDGKVTNQILHIAVDTALPANLPDGGEHPYYDDRVIAHEMVHAIMGRTMNFSSLPNWFKEGTAEFIHGANEWVATDLSRNGGGIEGAQAIQNALGDGTNDTWVGNNIQYSSSAMAVRYLHEQIQADGHSGRIKDLLNDLKNNPTEDLDQALSHVSNYADTRAFVNDFVANGNGASFIHNLEQSCELTKTLLGGDTGGIGGASDNIIFLLQLLRYFFLIHYPHSHMKRAYIDILHRPHKSIFCITAFGLSQQPEYVYKHAQAVEFIKKG